MGEEGIPFSTPGRVRPRKRPYRDVSCEVKEQIRKLIYDACDKRKTITVVQLLQQIRGNNIPFYGKVSTLRKLLHDIGFSHIRRNNNRYLVEQPHIIAARIEFLGRYKYYFDRKRRFIFQDETWIFRNGTGKTFEWQDSSTRSVSVKKASTGPRYIVCHAGGRGGFVNGASLVVNTQKKPKEYDDYHGDMNGDMFKKWLTEKLLPNLEEPSVIVMDNASYHSTQSEKQPTSAWKKPALINWLTENKIPHDARSTVKDLYALCQSYKKPISHEITEIIHKSGHEVLKTPPYCYFYNPIELVWGFCKRYYDAHVAPDCDYSEKKAMQIWEEALSQVTPERWNRYVDHTEKKVFEDYKRFYEEKFTVEIEDNPGLANNSDSDYNDDDDDDDMVTVDGESEIGTDVSDDRSHLDAARKRLETCIENNQSDDSDDENIAIVNPSAAEITSMPIIFTNLSTDISLQEEVVAYDEYSQIMESDNIGCFEGNVDNENTSTETTIEIQDQLQAAVKSIITSSEISLKMSHIIEENEKLLTNFFKNIPNHEGDDENDNSTVTIDSLLELHKAKLGSGDENLFSTNVGMTVRVTDLKRLIPPNELNDEIINLYMKIISNRSRVDIFTFDTHFYPQLNKGFKNAQKWTRNVDILTKSLIFIPIHLGNHWTLCVVDVTTSSIHYYDSLGGKNLKSLDIIEGYLVATEKEKYQAENSVAQPRKWAKKHAKDIPMQNNSYDCGVFVCFYAKQLSMLKTIPKINTANMNRFRTQMLRNILESHKSSSTSESANSAQNSQISAEMTKEIELPSPQQCNQSNTSMNGVYLYQSAHYHQGSSQLFSHRQAGLQCTAIATYAIAALPNKLSHVTSQDLDEILVGGDSYYLQCRKAATEDMLNVDELLSNFLVKNKLAIIVKKEDISCGSLLDENPLSSLYKSIIQHVLPTIEPDCGYLFITQSKTVSFKYLYSPNVNSPDFFLFNSHPVDENNCIPEEGTDAKARLFRCCGTLALAMALLAGTNLNCGQNNKMWAIYKIKSSISSQI